MLLEVPVLLHQDRSSLGQAAPLTRGQRCGQGAIHAAESVLFFRVSGKWSSTDKAADRC